MKKFEIETLTSILTIKADAFYEKHGHLNIITGAYPNGVKVAVFAPGYWNGCKEIKEGSN